MDVRKEIPDCKKASVGKESIEFPSFSGKDTKLPEINILIQRYVVIKNFDASLNDTLTFSGIQMRVVGIADYPVMINNAGYMNGVQVIVADSIYNAVVGSHTFSEIYPTLKERADAKTFESWLDDWCTDNPGSHWLSYRMSDEQMKESFAQIQMLCWALILFIGIIGVLNIINTVYSNIHTRISEIGIQRAVGMSKKKII